MNKKIFLTFFLFLVCFLSTNNINSSNLKEDKSVNKIISEMSIDEKIGQLIMPAIHVDDLNEEEILKNIKNFKVGGYHFLIGKELVGESQYVKDTIERIQGESNLPLLIAADFEGGVGFYFKDAIRLPRAMAIGATFDESKAYQAGYITAQEARTLGFHVNFYPDVDINSNSKNPIINIRSFGSDPTLVSEMARAYVKGFSAGGGLSVAKHFPGHGDTITDSHLMLPSTNANWSRLSKVELKPFYACIQEGVHGIMSGHITLPTVDQSKKPATLSKLILTDLLKNKMEFEGLIFTDAMMMGGITKHYHKEKACVMALNAGADIILYPNDVEKSFNAIKTAVINEEISEERIDESVRKILLAKKRLKLSNYKNNDPTNNHQQLSKQIIQSAITLLKDEDGLIPVKLEENQKLVVLNILDSEDGWRSGKPGKSFYEGLRKKYKNVENIYLTNKTKSSEIETIKKKIQKADLVIVAGFIQVSAFKGSIDFTREQASFLRTLPSLQKNVILAMFGNPYAISDFPKAKTIVLAYENYPEAENALLESILGKTKFQGKLPINIDSFPLGYSLAQKPSVN